MKRLLMTMLLLAGAHSAVTNADAVVQDAQESLKAWRPKSIVTADGRLRVTARERRISAETFRAMLGDICSELRTRRDALAGITEIQIVNRFSNQGFVFAGGEEQCSEINELPKSEMETFVREISHSF